MEQVQIDFRVEIGNMIIYVTGFNLIHTVSSSLYYRIPLLNFHIVFSSVISHKILYVNVQTPQLNVICVDFFQDNLKIEIPEIDNQC